MDVHILAHRLVRALDMVLLAHLVILRSTERLDSHLTSAMINLALLEPVKLEQSKKQLLKLATHRS
jgi:hypothetical protein